jgi:hypothetical protein
MITKHEFDETVRQLYKDRAHLVVTTPQTYYSTCVTNTEFRTVDVIRFVKDDQPCEYCGSVGTCQNARGGSECSGCGHPQ